MSSNRNTRNPQQLRALIQNMGRSIEEARTRRLGPPSSSPSPSVPAIAQTNARQQPPLRTEPQRPGSSNGPGSNGSGSNSPPAPPVRAATEMFDGEAPRLKARPKRAS